jgi:hypothetical protein
MSCADRARQCVLDAAQDITNMANRIGVMRSVDATESARWLREVASELRAACGDDSPPDLAHSEQKP